MLQGHHLDASHGLSSLDRLFDLASDLGALGSVAFNHAGQSHSNPALHKRCEFVRPLANRRVRDPHGLGRGSDRTAEQLDCVGFLHSDAILAHLHLHNQLTYIRPSSNSTYMSTLQARIAELMESTGWKVGDMAQIAGVSSSAVTQWKDGPTQTIKLEPATRLAARSGYGALWIANGKGPKREVFTGGNALLGPLLANEPARPARHVPVLGTAKFASDGFFDESPAEGGKDGHVVLASVDPAAYVLRIRGQSVFPALRDGWYLLIEPTEPPQVGEYVLLQLKTGRKMVKELLNLRPNSLELMSVNGSDRLTYELTELERLHAISAIVSPSRWRAE